MRERKNMAEKTFNCPTGHIANPVSNPKIGYQYKSNNFPRALVHTPSISHSYGTFNSVII